MKFKTLIPAGALCVTALCAVGAHAEPNKEQYELQARCGKDAAVFFNRFNETDGGKPAVSFTNHYNPDLNGCFVLVNRTVLATPGKPLSWVEWDLWDVNENREVDVMGSRPDPEDFQAAAKGTPAGAPQPTLGACLIGNFERCGDRGEYFRRFARMVMFYMQRAVP